MAAIKILVVDDHREFLEILSVQLRTFGWDLTLASSAREAFQKLKEVQPNVILLDLRMPVMDGVQTARALKSRPEYNNIPILAFSACGLRSERQRCLEAGCDDYLSKPFTLSDLKERVVRLLAGRASTKRHVVGVEESL
jgi:CheY-like chemotaxis protein